MIVLAFKFLFVQDLSSFALLIYLSYIPSELCCVALQTLDANYPDAWHS